MRCGEKDVVWVAAHALRRVPRGAVPKRPWVIASTFFPVERLCITSRLSRSFGASRFISVSEFAAHLPVRDE